MLDLTNFFLSLHIYKYKYNKIKIYKYNKIYMYINFNLFSEKLYM